MAIEAHTWPERKARSSPRSPVVPAVPRSVTGTSARMPTRATTPIALIVQNVERQPAACPNSVPKGTPSTFAAVRPVNMTAIAPAFLWGATMSAATTAPIPKKAPWQSAATTRPSSMVGKSGASAESVFPTTKRTINPARTGLRGSRVTAAVRTSAPTTTLSA